MYDKIEAVINGKYTFEKDGGIMMFPFLTLDDETEIVHSEMRSDGKVKVYMEKPDSEVCFKHATCYIPGYKWEDIYEFSQEEIDRLEEIIRSTIEGSDKLPFFEGGNIPC